MELFTLPKESNHSNTIVPIHTDLYEITMAYSYFKQNRHNEIAIFEAFFRKCPFGGEYVIFAGLREVLTFIHNYKFTNEQIDYIFNILDEENEGFREWLKKLDCSKIKIRAFSEGSIVFPKEPLIIIEGPLGLVQMLETTLLNLISYPSLVSTNASRMKLLAGNSKLLEFGLRRAQGPDGGLSASQYSYLGGFDGTSNVLAGMKFQIPVSGTMAHSFVTSFDNLNQLTTDCCIKGVDLKEKVLNYRNKFNLNHTNDGELASFISFALTFPQKFLCLIDTYHTLNSGILNFMIVSIALDDIGFKPVGIRLDSGDLALLSKKVKEIFKQYGKITNKDFTNLIVVASDDINEEKLQKLKDENHEIDSFGIGTNIVTCQKQPALGMVYKLIEYRNIPRMKFSEDGGKATLPGNKNVFRIKLKSSEFNYCDVISLPEEEISPFKEFQVRKLTNLNRKFVIIAEKVENMLELYYEGKLIKHVNNLKEAKLFYEHKKQFFNPEIFAIKNPQNYQVYLSEKFYQLFYETLNKITAIEKIE